MALARRDSPLLALPFELQEFVIDHLPPHQCFYLSQTCKTLRLLAYGRWNGHVTDEDGRKSKEFVLEVALRLDDAWACEKCRKVHHEKADFAPDYGVSFPCRQFQKYLHYHYLTPYYSLERQPGGPSYQFSPVVVQMAVKYSIRGRKAKLQRFLQPFFKREDARGIIEEGTVSLLFWPKVINGRFIAYSEHTLRLDNPGVPFTAEHFQYSIMARLCPCTVFNFSISESIKSYLPEPGEEKTRYCHHSASDFAVLVEGSTLYIKTWRDFGGYGTEEDALKAQGLVGHYIYEREQEYGSVRAAWEASSSASDAE